ncbi:hypothetical protein [Streptomyces sp. NPDC005969]|uniref:hypothetical protein n=1 Tax=Streptomyces sp. NPDC005969 TaxID=3156722 RepID=UPI0033F912BF
MAHVLAILQAEPERLWRAREIAELLGDVTLVATYRQLARWTEKGMIKRARTGHCTALTQTTNPLRDLRKTLTIRPWGKYNRLAAVGLRRVWRHSAMAHIRLTRSVDPARTQL